MNAATSRLLKSLMQPSDSIWIDPTVVVGSTELLVSDVQVPMAAPTLIAPQNNRRIAIGFVSAIAPAAPILIGPWSDVSSFAVGEIDAGNFLYYKLEDYTSLVGGKWWGEATAAVSFRLIQILRVRR